MNEMNGISATKQITAADPAAKIVILSDYDDAALRQAAMNAGACDYALKDNLLNLIRLVEDMRQSAPGQPGTETTTRTE